MRNVFCKFLPQAPSMALEIFGVYKKFFKELCMKKIEWRGILG
jgi:hypothetical protein